MVLVARTATVPRHLFSPFGIIELQTLIVIWAHSQFPASLCGHILSLNCHLKNWMPSKDIASLEALPLTWSPLKWWFFLFSNWVQRWDPCPSHSLFLPQDHYSSFLPKNPVPWKHLFLPFIAVIYHLSGHFLFIEDSSPWLSALLDTFLSVLLISVCT